jgi:hypothetical protein
MIAVKRDLIPIVKVMRTTDSDIFRQIQLWRNIFFDKRAIQFYMPAVFLEIMIVLITGIQDQQPAGKLVEPLFDLALLYPIETARPDPGGRNKRLDERIIFL